MKLTIICALIVLAGCGGGGGSDGNSAPTPATIEAGSYSAWFTTPNETGELFTQSTQAVYRSRFVMGFTEWSYSNGRAFATLTVLTHPIDALRNEFPSAKASGQNRPLDLATTGGSSWVGGGVVLARSDRQSLPVASLPRNWHFGNLYNFGGVFLDYTMQIDVDTAGVISGFDTNGCQFRGQMQLPSAGSAIYTVSITTALCGATASYIEDAQYDGFASSDGQALVIAAVNRARQLGLSVHLFPR